MKKIGLILLLLLVSISQGASQVIVYVDPDATGAANGTSFADAYTGLGAALDAEEKNISVDSGSDEQYTFQCRSSGGSDDTSVTFSKSWTSRVANYVEVIGMDFPGNGIYDDSKYVIKATDATVLNLSENFVRFVNIQFELTVVADASANMIFIGTQSASNLIRFDSCIFKGICAGTGAGRGVRADNINIDLRIFNTTIYGFVSGADADFIGLYIDAVSTSGIYNNTIYGCGIGIKRDAGSVTAKNNIVGNNNDDFSGTISIDYCLSDDGDGTNEQGPKSGTWSAELTDANNGDFRLVTDANSIGNGVDDPGSGLYSDDIIGSTRVSTWAIGAFEWSGGPNVQGTIISQHHEHDFTNEIHCILNPGKGMAA